MHSDCIAYDKHTGAMLWDCIANDNEYWCNDLGLYLLMIRIVVQCIGTKLLLVNSIVVCNALDLNCLWYALLRNALECIRIALLMISNLCKA